MSDVLTIARLVVREATRRRLVFALVALTVIVVLLSGWGFSRIPDVGTVPPSRTQVLVAAASLLILVTFMFSFVLAFSATFVASPALSGEVEAGVAQAMLSRPLTRARYVLGKWLGLVALVVAYAAGAAALELLAMRIALDYVPPAPVEAIAYLAGEGIVMLTLALALSTRLSGMTGGVIAVVLFGVAWLGAILGGVGAAFGNATITHAGTVTKLLLPTDALWRGTLFALEPVSLRSLGTGAIAAANPFYASAPPPPTVLAWALFWIVAVLALAVWSFSRREL